MRSAIARKVGRAPTASGYMITPGHGPSPSGRCRDTGQVPSAVATVRSRTVMAAVLPRRERSCDHTRAEGEQDGLRAVARTQLAPDAGEVALDGQRGDPEVGGDVAVGATVGDALQHLDLPRRQRGDGAGRGAHPRPVL